MPSLRVLTAPRGAWVVTALDADGGGRIGDQYRFARGDVPVPLVVGEPLLLRLHGLGDGEIGLLGVAPLVGRLTPAQRTGLVPREGAAIASEATLVGAPLAFHPQAVARAGDQLILTGVDRDTATYGFRGGDWTFEGAFVCEGVAFDQLLLDDEGRPRELLGVCGADPLEHAFCERSAARALVLPVFVLVHPWDEAGCLSFVAAERVHYVPPLARELVDSLLATLTKLDGFYEYNLTGCTLRLDGSSALLTAIARDGAHFDVATLPVHDDTARRTAELFTLALQQILATTGDTDAQ